MTDLKTIVEQPQSISGVPGESGPVTVRIMTKEDVHFAADLSVEAFRSKTEAAVGKNNVEKTKQFTAEWLLASPQWVYERNLVAFYNGERAGVCALKFHGDKNTAEPDTSNIGCCFLMRLGCFECLMAEDVPPNTVYVEHICVDSAFRGKGIGKVLLDRADYEARKNDAKTLSRVPLVTACSYLTQTFIRFKTSFGDEPWSFIFFKFLPCLFLKLIYLAVTQDNRARNLYTRHGYEITEDIHGYCITYCMLGVRDFYKMSKPLV